MGQQTRAGLDRSADLDFTEEFADAAQWFAHRLGRASMAAPVPTCPGWSVLDLVVHLGNVHSWAASVLETGRAAERPDGAPDSQRPRRVAQWYEGRAEDLYTVLRATPLDRPCWSFADGDGVAGFWHRRMTHETVMHGLDLARATGVEERLPEHLAADGVDEALAVFLHRMHTRGHPADLTEPLELRATDTGDAWTVSPEPGDASPRVVRGRPGDGGDAVEAPARVLLELLWKRAPLTAPAVRICGDTGRVTRFLSSPLTA